MAIKSLLSWYTESLHKYDFLTEPQLINTINNKVILKKLLSIRNFMRLNPNEDLYFIDYTDTVIIMSFYSTLESWEKSREINL